MQGCRACTPRSRRLRTALNPGQSPRHSSQRASASSPEALRGRTAAVKSHAQRPGNELAELGHDGLRPRRSHTRRGRRCHGSGDLGRHRANVHRSLSDGPDVAEHRPGRGQEKRAEQLLCALQSCMGGLVLRTQGRQYPGEDRPRWSLGLYARRDGTPVWRGPPDPALATTTDSDYSLGVLQSEFCASLQEIGCGAKSVAGDEGCLHVFALFPGDVGAPGEDDRNPGLSESMLGNPALADLQSDDLTAAQGLLCFVLDRIDWQGSKVARIELPDCGSVEQFARCLAAIGTAATKAGLPALLLTGHPPPVDATVSWTTITP
ncbi:MAG: transglutaminase-like family protein, partial [Rhodospirillales bacterium]|nr:transglutaminase-like family protein [Rhodospirillales bacterium]